MTPEQKAQEYAQEKHIELMDRICPSWNADEVIRHVNDAFLAGYAERDKEDEWISVEDMWPQLGETVDFIVFSGRRITDYIYNGETSFDLITHWRKLPNPPKTK